MSHTITLIPGDGIGPEVTEAVLRIFKVAAVDIAWDRHEAGLIAFKRYNQSLPVAVLDSIRRNKVALRSEEHTSELQSHSDLVCRLLLEKKKKQTYQTSLPKTAKYSERARAPRTHATARTHT